MSRVQERTIFFPVSSTTFHHTLTSAPNGISLNREGTHCAVGGRNLLKVFSIDEKRFTEKTNLVVGPKKLNYSIIDVQWHPLEDNIIASAAGNGAVILWDVNKVNESKQEHVFQQHFRFVNKLCFHPTDPSLLMSCSQDGNMNCFDIRKKEVHATFCGKTEGIRDVQFHPFDRPIFCAACESGNVQLWDLRKPDHYYSQFTAHTGGPVFTLHWHPEDKFWLATGGRDKAIKVWDTQLRSHPTHVIQTIAPVNKIKWRPGYKYHIASCALFLDNNVNIWDIRRPYVPFAAFEEHKDVATGLIWQKDPDIILSCSKDKTIYNHIIKDAERPNEKAPPVAMSISPNGILGRACPIKKIQSGNYANGRLSLTIPGVPNVKKTSAAQEFKPENSILNFFDVREHLEEIVIEKLAKNYKFHGLPFSDLCDHNARVAEQLSLADKAHTWMIVKQLYLDKDQTEKEQHMNLNSNFPLPSPALSSQYSGDVFQRKLDTPESFSENLLNDSDGSDDNGSSVEFHTPLITQYNDLTLGPELDAVFGDEDYNMQFISAEIGNEDDDLDLLPSEAIQLRQPFGEKAVSSTDDAGEDVHEKNVEGQIHALGLDLPRWNYESLVQEMLFHYAEQGDLQTCVTVLLTLKEFGRILIDLTTQEEWFHGYLDILYQLHLFNIATDIINHSPMPVNSLNQNSTTFHMQCGNCNKVMTGTAPGWYCTHCKKAAQVCSICHIPVKGLYAWCQGCGHGGHMHHVKTWFQAKTYCPAGCGHKCEYS